MSEPNEICEHENPDDSPELKKQFNKLKYKALYINAEYEDTLDIFSFAQSEFISKMLNYCGDNKIRPPFGDKKQEEKKSAPETKEEIKELYREIVKATHPDKTKNLSEEEIQERQDLYVEAVKGKKTGDFWGVFKAALELDLPIKQLSQEYISELEKAISSMEGKINKMKNDLMYKWYYLDEPSQQNIFEQLTKNQEKYE